MRLKKTQLTLITCLLLWMITKAQDSSKLDKLISFPEKLFSSLDKKTASVTQKLNNKTDKYLDKLERQEHHLRMKLWKKDSSLAKQVFDGTREKYEGLRKLSGNVNKYAATYSGHLDSLTTALRFLNTQNLSGNLQLQQALQKYNELQLRLNASDQIKEYVTQRREILKQQFQQLGMIKELKKFRKEVYYYQQQVADYKRAFEDPSRIEQMLLSVVTRTSQFRDFFAHNSTFGSLFSLPSSTNNTTIVAGLQTRQTLNQSLIARFGSTASITQQLQQNVQNAQGQLNALKNKLSSLSSGNYGNGDPDIPGFRPSSQRTKSFAQRLEYGGNIQSQRARYFFPATSDIAFSLGYKLNDKSTIGIGASYKMGWGNNWNNIKISHQGVGLRSYLDWKIKGSFYFSGGYEQNYRNMINSVDQLRDYSAWQSSGLIGLSKKYAISKKMKGEMRLLWDFMSYQQIPKSQPVVFRIGYSLK